ncbi:MAG: methyl coenzyme M reductase system, component A2 [Candidatus Methanofastidiosa archaeon]|nr:methyl coenzyme M reductase system, component A2 [Candidatus Methanofastidiosa archaeon]
MENKFIEVENLSFIVDNTTILDNISFVINEGDSLGIYGPTGSGKSVLLNILRGTKGYKPSSGAVYYNIAYCSKCNIVNPPSYVGTKCLKCNLEFSYKKINFWNDEEFFNIIKRRTAIMFQRTFALFGQRSVLENMYEIYSEMQMPEKDINSKIIEILQKVNLLHRMTHVARDLSGGEKQRLVLARQLALDPIILFADEPTETLDPVTSDIIKKSLIDMFKNRSKSLVLSSQKSSLIGEVTERTLKIDRGKIIEELDSKELKIEDKSISRDTKSIFSDTGNEIIQLNNVKKYFYSISRGVIKAVDDLSLSVNEKEIFGIVGKSGAGKTTVSKIIGGLIPFKEGEFKLRIGDEWINMKEDGSSGRIRAAPYIGILHQEYSLYPNKTVLENLTESIGLKLPLDIAKKKASDVLEAVGFDNNTVEELLIKTPESLSEGERHTVALAQVLIKEPNIVILDEPRGTKEIANAIRKSRQYLDETFIIITHDSDFVVDACDRSCFLLEGKIIEIGPPEEIKNRMISREIEEIKKESMKVYDSIHQEQTSIDTTERQDSGY